MPSNALPRSSENARNGFVMNAPILRAVECLPMKGRLIYVIGPSGSGKDSVIDYARARLPADSNVVFARRTITRPAEAGGERHEAVTPEAFEKRLAQGGFAMHWHANGLSYGIGREIGDWLESGRTVVVSGSRAHLPDAMAEFPALEVVHVSAPLETLKHRLAARGREDAAQVARRIERAARLGLPEGTQAFEISNDGELANAGESLLAFIT